MTKPHIYLQGTEPNWTGFAMLRPDCRALLIKCDDFPNRDAAWKHAMAWYQGGSSPYEIKVA